MAEITTTQSFSDGDTVTATKLNNIQGNASIQPEAITNRTAETTVDQANDLVLMYDASATALKKVSLSNLIKAGTASDFPVTGNATIGQTLGVIGNTSVSTLEASGTISATKATGTGLAVTSNATVGGSLGVTGSSTLANTAVIGTLGVSDTISATKSTGTGLAVTNNATVGGTLAVTGAITATSTINGTTIPTTKTLVTTVDTQTLTNKTLTTPVISSISNTGTLTLPTTTDTLVGRATTDTLTNKTLTSPVISSISNTGTITIPTSTDTLVGRATTDTLTNKTLTSPVINTATISGGTINGAVIGGTTAAAGSFTTINASQLITATAGVSGNVTGSSGSCTGNAATATTLQTARTIEISGDVTGTATSFNGSANVSIPATLANSGVTSGNYGSATQIPSITIDAKGRITSASNNSFSTTPADGSITPAKLSQPLTRATAVASTSGTVIDFTGIPSWVRRITVMFASVSTTSGDVLLQLGTGTTPVTSGYQNTASASSYGTNATTGTSSTTGFRVAGSNGGNLASGSFTILLISGTTYVSSYSASVTGSVTGGSCGGGWLDLGGSLGMVRLTPSAGNFDSGTINIMYEG